MELGFFFLLHPPSKERGSLASLFFLRHFLPGKKREPKNQGCPTSLLIAELSFLMSLASFACSNGD